MSNPQFPDKPTSQSLLRYAPSPVIIIAVTLVILAAIGSMTALIYAGRDVTELRVLFNTILNALGAVTGVGSMIYAGAAARRSNDAAIGVNGQLSKRIEDTVKQTVSEHTQTLLDAAKDNPNGR